VLTEQASRVCRGIIQHEHTLPGAGSMSDIAIYQQLGNCGENGL
jgi:hypothetical protein